MSKTGDWIREKRKRKGLLQSQVAERAGVSTSYISTLERGQKHSTTDATLTPEREKVISIARAVGGKSDELLLLFGYAPDDLISNTPQNLNELLARLEAIGITNLHFADEDKLRFATPDELQKVLDAVKFAVQLTVQQAIPSTVEKDL